MKNLLLTEYRAYIGVHMKHVHFSIFIARLVSLPMLLMLLVSPLTTMGANADFEARKKNLITVTGVSDWTHGMESSDDVEAYIAKLDYHYGELYAQAACHRENLIFVDWQRTGIEHRASGTGRYTSFRGRAVLESLCRQPASQTRNRADSLAEEFSSDVKNAMVASIVSNILDVEGRLTDVQGGLSSLADDPHIVGILGGIEAIQGYIDTILGIRNRLIATRNNLDSVQGAALNQLKNATDEIRSAEFSANISNAADNVFRGDIPQFDQYRDQVDRMMGNLTRQAETAYNDSKDQQDREFAGLLEKEIEDKQATGQNALKAALQNKLAQENAASGEPDKEKNSLKALLQSGNNGNSAVQTAGSSAATAPSALQSQLASANTGNEPSALQVTRDQQVLRKQAEAILKLPTMIYQEKRRALEEKEKEVLALDGVKRRYFALIYTYGVWINQKYVSGSCTSSVRPGEICIAIGHYEGGEYVEKTRRVTPWREVLAGAEYQEVIEQWARDLGLEVSWSDSSNPDLGYETDFQSIDFSSMPVSSAGEEVRAEFAAARNSL